MILEQIYGTTTSQWFRSVECEREARVQFLNLKTILEMLEIFLQGLHFKNQTLSY